MSKVESVFSRLRSKLEQMSTDELDTQLKKHECAGGPKVFEFLNLGACDCQAKLRINAK